MSYDIDINPVEVLKCLNYLGYTNIPTIVLRDFIHDLKKLIKHKNSKSEQTIKKDTYKELKFKLPLSGNSNNCKETYRSILSNSQSKHSNQSSYYLSENKENSVCSSHSSRHSHELFTSTVKNDNVTQSSPKNIKKNDLPNKKSKNNLNSMVKDKNVFNSTIIDEEESEYSNYTDVSSDKSNHTSSSESLIEELSESLKNEKDIFLTLYTKGTESSNAKKVTTKKIVINFDSQKISHPHCVHASDINDLHLIKDKIPSTKVTVETQTSFDNEKKNQKIRKTKSEEIRRPSYIKPCIRKVSSKRSDPVNLYHYYEEEWKKIKIPGACNKGENKLRWNIREKMSCQCNCKK